MKAPYQLLRAARAALGIGHVILAREAGVSKRTLVRIDTLRGVSEESREKVQAAFEARGVEFLAPQDGSGPGLRVPEDVVTPPTARRHEPGRKRKDKRQAS